MLRGLDAFNKWLEKVLEWVLLGLLGLFLSLILYQVVSRNLPVLPTIYWTEEFSRFSFQWAIMLGTALGVYHFDHFVLDAFPKNSRIDRFTRYSREIVLVIIAVFFIWSGWEFAETGWRRRSTAAQLPMFWVYVCFFASGVLMALFSLQRLLTLVTKGLDALEHELNASPPEEVALQESDAVPSIAVDTQSEDR
ncbi:TRAP transporter small permease [Ruegeria profundi]|uniref:TRAP transporter small permease n=1 Tax=Ruegeria profundi TaxID=1685378 RepID=UPI001CD7D516|nr:TRAP transporter small permease [Ruegeria profundi]MCA0928240.1 TRAP transporter small permease [Ruegeria profundi]